MYGSSSEVSMEECVDAIRSYMSSKLAQDLAIETLYQGPDDIGLKISDNY